MNRRYASAARCFGSIVAMLTALVIVAPVSPARAQSILGRAAPPSHALVPNRGQIRDLDDRPRPEILYAIATANGTLFVSRTRLSFVFERRTPDSAVAGHRVDLELLGTLADGPVSASDSTDDFINYYFGGERDGITRVHGYRQVRLHDVYPGIDMLLSARDTGIKADFLVRPGADPSIIRMRVAGTDDVELTEGGALVIRSPLGEIRQDPPVVLQRGEAKGEHVIPARYELRDGVVSLVVDAYDRTRELVVDPYVAWASYYGGLSDEATPGSNPVAFSPTGMIHLVGSTINRTGAAAFPTSAGAFQSGRPTSSGFVVKFRPDGTRVWATLYGPASSVAATSTWASSVATDAAGAVFFAGRSSSGTASPFPTTAGAFQTTGDGGFLVKLDSNGARRWATLYGTSGTTAAAHGVAVDRGGNAVVALAMSEGGYATTGAFQTTHNGDGDAHIVKFDGAGNRLWSTYLGGRSMEAAYGIAVDRDNNVVVTGMTGSGDFPATTGAHQTSIGGSTDAFVARFSSAGRLLWATYLGGSGTENSPALWPGHGWAMGGDAYAWGAVAADSLKEITVTGYSTGQMSITTPAHQFVHAGGADAFVARFDSNGTRRWTTYLGGSGNDVGLGVATYPNGTIFLSGATSSSNLSIGTGAIQAAKAGDYDVFVARMTAAGSLAWGTYLGGSGRDDRSGVSLDAFGGIALGGTTASTNFPVGATSYQPRHPTTEGEAFLGLLCDPIAPTLDSSGSLRLCIGGSVDLIGPEGYPSYLWSNGVASRVITVRTPGAYYLEVRLRNGCSATSKPVQVIFHERRPPVVVPGGVNRICPGDSLVLEAYGTFSDYRWSTGARTRSITVGAAGRYRVHTIDTNGCADSSAFVDVILNPSPGTVTVSPRGPVVVCEGDPLTLTASDADGEYEWNNGLKGKSFSPGLSGRYRVRVTNDEGCFVESNEVVVTIAKPPVARIGTPSGTSLCEGDSILLESEGTFVAYEWSTGSRLPTAYGRGGTVRLIVTDTNGCRDTATVELTTRPKPRPAITAAGAGSLCPGGAVRLSVDRPFASYRWSTGARGASIDVRDSGRYWVEVTDASGCSGRSPEFHVRMNAPPNVSLSGPAAVCPGSIATYEVPGGAGLRFTWSVTGGGSIVGGGTSSSVSVSWGGAGAVHVTAEDTRTGCTATSQLAVTISDQLVPSVSTSRAPSLCRGDSIVLDAGSGYVSHIWSNGATTRSITVREPGTYTVTVLNAAGCGGTSLPVVVTVDSIAAPLVVAGSSTALCAGDSVVLSTAEEYAAYAWSTGERTRSIVVREAGSYSVVATGAGGCSAPSETIVVTRLAPAVVGIDGPQAVCTGSEATYCASDASQSDFVWDVAGGAIIGGQGTSCVRVRWNSGAAGTVTLAARGVDGCSGRSAPLAVALGDTIAPRIAARPSLDLCAGDTVVLDAGAGFATYRWSTGATTRTIEVSSVGRYGVEVDDGNGCRGSAVVDVREVPAPVARIEIAGPTEVCEGMTVELRSATEHASYRWSDGRTTRAITVTSSGDYVLAVSDGGSCEGISAPVTVTVHPLPAPTIVRDADTLAVDLVARQYQWRRDGSPIPGATGPRLVTDVPGSYTVAIVDANGCAGVSPPIVRRAAAAASVSLPSIEARPGDRLRIPIVLGAQTNLPTGAFSARIRFDRTLLLPTGSTPLGVIEGRDRVVTITGTSASLAPGSTLAELELIAALGDTNMTALDLEWIVWQDAEVTATIADGMVRIIAEGGWTGFIDTGRVQLAPPRPNPATGLVALHYALIEPGPTTLELVDARGAVIRTLLSLPAASAGEGVVELDTRELPTGSYRLRLRTPSGMAEEGLVVVR